MAPANPPPNIVPRCAVGVSARGDNAIVAAERAAQDALEGLGGQPCHLAVVFASQHFRRAIPAQGDAIRRVLDAPATLGVSVEAVAAGELELEKTPAVAVFAATLPGVDITAFTLGDLGLVGPHPKTDPIAIRDTAGLDDRCRGVILACDPYSTPINAALPVLSELRPNPAEPGGPRIPIVGGLASAGSTPGNNVLLLNDRVLTEGGVGISLRGDITIDAVVSQGCRPIGPIYEVTAARGQLLEMLDGQPSLGVLRGLLDSLADDEKELLRKGLFIGGATRSDTERLGRDDYVIRGVLGVDDTAGGLIIGDLIRPGQLVRFHARDRATADDDLALLLDKQQLYDPPIGALMFTCNARGTRLFDKPNHDAAAVTRAFSRQHQAADGTPDLPGVGIAPRSAAGRPLPLAGCFAAGEIGPIGDEIHLHGHTTSIALFRNYTT